MQRPRCWYFRNEEFNCLKKGGARCFAVDGENQFHAIFGDGPCHIVHPSSLAVPLIAYGGASAWSGPQGEREIEADKFFLMPDRNMYGETVLEPNELVTHVILPTPPNAKSAPLRGEVQAVARLADRDGVGGAADERRRPSRARASCSARWRRCRGDRRPPKPC